LQTKSTSLSYALLVLGAFLFLIGLLQGTIIQVFHSPRLALSAHIAAVQNGMVLLIFGLLWSRLRLSETLARVASISAIGGMYLIWIGFTLAATTGSSMVLQFAGAGYTASPKWEWVVAAIIYAGSAASIVAAFLVLVGLVKKKQSLSEHLLEE
jgi:hydroxylaminobenzene mutase